MPPGLLERLAAGPVLGDGGYLLELERRGWVRAGSFTPEVSVVHPEALVELHREFLHAGAEVLQALTFYAGEDRLAAAGPDRPITPSGRPPPAGPWALPMPARR
jgi:S-methylmethionine-dependent homocysteine/selenocysteine methylase